MDGTTLLIFAVAYLAVVAVPGPAVAALVARVLARGPAGAPAFILGCAAGSLAWFVVAAFGLAAVVAGFAAAFAVLRYAGAAYLLYVAWKLWTTAPMAGSEPAKLAPESPGQMFLAGLAINLGNPKAVVFFLALLPTVVDLGTLTTGGIMQFGLIIPAVVAGVFGAYAFAAARTRRLFRSPRAMRLVRRGSAVAVAGAGATIATR